MPSNHLSLGCRKEGQKSEIIFRDWSSGGLDWGPCLTQTRGGDGKKETNTTVGIGGTQVFGALLTGARTVKSRWDRRPMGRMAENSYAGDGEENWTQKRARWEEP